MFSYRCGHCKNETKYKNALIPCCNALRVCLIKPVVLVLMGGMFCPIPHMRSQNRAQSFIHLLMLVREYMPNSVFMSL